ncbi:MAG: tRNA pseudouridine synthase A [Thermoprotei archaeon]|jgi:hypothetical protein
MKYIEKVLNEADIIKAKEPDRGFGISPYERPIEEYLSKGFILLDKPRGPSSHEVVAWIKKMMNIKAGHGGTLEQEKAGKPQSVRPTSYRPWKRHKTS